MRITYQVGADSRQRSGQGCEPPPASCRQSPRGSVRWPRPAAEHHARSSAAADADRQGKFYSSIISVNVDIAGQPAIVRDVQMHPARNAVVHVDLQRVLENEKLKIHLPIHFKGEASAPGVKTQGGIVSHLIQDIEVSCLPKDLPEFLELDLSAMNSERDQASVGCPVACGSHDSGAGASQSAGRLGAQPARCRAGAGGSAAAATEGAVAAAPAAGADAAAAAGKKAEAEEGRREGGAQEGREEVIPDIRGS
jgi:large subunit ribosomal protein L25